MSQILRANRLSLIMHKRAAIEWEVVPKFELISNGGKWNKFICVEAGVVDLQSRGIAYEIEFPVGWQTDVTSSPLWARTLLPQLGAHSPASLLHDRLLDIGYSRKFARAQMSTQLRLLPQVSRWTRFRMVAGVWAYDQIHKFKK